MTFSPHKKLHIGDKRAFPRVCSSTMHLQNNAQRVIVGKDTTSIHPNHILHQFHLIVPYFLISVTPLNRHHNVSQTDRYLAIQGNIIFDRCSVRSRVGLSGVTGGMTGL